MKKLLLEIRDTFLCNSDVHLLLDPHLVVQLLVAVHQLRQCRLFLFHSLYVLSSLEDELFYPRFFLNSKNFTLL